MLLSTVSFSDEGREITQQLGTNESDEEIALPYRKSVAEIISF